MDIQIAQAALRKVAERIGVPLKTVLESIQEVIQQSDLSKETTEGKTRTPEEIVALLGDAVLEARRQEMFFNRQ